MDCLRCHAPMLKRAGGRHEHVCRSCGGRLVEGDDGRRLLFEELGVGPSWMMELKASPTTNDNCPMCQQAMTLSMVKGFILDCCRGCGALFMDAGELAALTMEPEVGGPTQDADYGLFLMTPTIGLTTATAALDQAGLHRLNPQDAATISVGGIVAVDLTALEANALGAALASLGHPTGVVRLSEPMPIARRAAEAAVDEDQLVVSANDTDRDSDRMTANLSDLVVVVGTLPITRKGAPSGVRVLTEVMAHHKRFRIDDSTFTRKIVGMLAMAKALHSGDQSVVHRGLAASSKAELPSLVTSKQIELELRWLQWRRQQPS